MKRIIGIYDSGGMEDRRKWVVWFDKKVELSHEEGKHQYEGLGIYQRTDTEVEQSFRLYGDPVPELGFFPIAFYDMPIGVQQIVKDELGQTAAEPETTVEIVIDVEGGNVNSVMCSHPAIVRIIDRDNDGRDVEDDREVETEKWKALLPEWPICERANL